MWRPRGIELLTFRPKALGLHLSLAPLGPAPMLNRQRLARLDVPDDLVHLDGIQRAFDVQDDGQHRDDVAIRHQQVARTAVAMRDECLDGLLASCRTAGPAHAPAADNREQTGCRGELVGASYPLSRMSGMRRRAAQRGDGAKVRDGP